MHAALMSTVSDFPAYAMLSGWSTKGRKSCPCCHYDTQSRWLDYSRKFCYRETRIFLDPAHPWRHDKRNFNGEIEERTAPLQLKGTEIEELLRDFPNEFGKKQKKKPDEEVPWRKLPILFILPYWKHCTNRHNLDVMHIEKNIFDNIIGTLLDIPLKTKDHVSARRDLEVLKIMPELQPIGEGDDEEIPRSRFWLTLEKKRLFCRIIKNAKIPQGYASNISRCVQVNEGKITGYKSHDAHFCIYYLLPIALKITLPKDVATPLIRLCHFFKGIWNKAINPRVLDNLHNEIVESLGQLETIFPPSFFTVMVHLPVHLVEEIRLGGPVCSRCMYSIERYLHELKDDVRNKAYPEGSMAEAYWAKECLRFCDRYINQSNTPSNIVKPSISQPFFPNIGRPTWGKGRTTKKNQDGFMIDHATWVQAHQYVLFNSSCEEIEEYIRLQATSTKIFFSHSDHMASISSHRKRKWDSAQNHSKKFMDWFKEKVTYRLEQGDVVSDHVKWLSKGPSFVAKRYTGYSVNGYHFHTMKRDANSVSQNHGVTLTALTPSFSSSKYENPIL
ncbi:uncharacterized protein [Spinacia oleracea]|uniref:DUF4218 domain-containing protein n=1 Tax=Spinacia oleracea TaxID=3562 RepID=A0ABM3R101_SPIOL|nr:uncharacterized protein LOC130463987 [Spinacia oleracea]